MYVSIAYTSMCAHMWFMGLFYMENAHSLITVLNFMVGGN